MTNRSDLEQSIIDTALMFAEKRGWESVRLHQIARALHIPLDEIRLHFREKEELIDAWFDHADEAMLQVHETESFEQGSTREKLHILIMKWLSALQPHRRVTRQMIVGKLEPGPYPLPGSGPAQSQPHRAVDPRSCRHLIELAVACA